jgi:hypothetical protein
MDNPTGTSDGKCLADKRSGESVIGFPTKFVFDCHTFIWKRTSCTIWLGEMGDSVFSAPYRLFPFIFDWFIIYIVPGFCEILEVVYIYSGVQKWLPLVFDKITLLNTMNIESFFLNRLHIHKSKQCLAYVHRLCSSLKCVFGEKWKKLWTSFWIKIL